ncbi:hypothetical protein GCM10007938_42820 [Vibrio zhanjiangensis]|uniref:Uncharacterized protein n=1 Tax=Vibrio zhanjiangensis TaxID=1046128 RepID=A0ABQ6F4M7_9VIBR|nr:hypothetical protein [Vibrio zhanjiangensis]GLT20497.1 hypothetical protein GCM10007938_42820 [Vibrio zhanjiangensis]
MKSFHSYMQDKTRALFKDMGAFFAFSHRQFDEARQEGVEYVALHAGLMVPKGNEQETLARLERIKYDAVSDYLKDRDKESVILDSLRNHECFYTRDISDCVDEMKDFNITKQEVLEVFFSRGTQLNSNY